MDNPRVVDLRSDTVTKPTPEMRQAMRDAEVGDDVFKEDPTVNELERVVAELLGKEAALYVPTGTMGNLAAVMAHCDRRGQEILVGDASHLFLNEQGGVAQVAGVQSWAVPTQKDGRLLVEDLEFRVRHRDFHCPTTSLLCLENTHNVCGGTVLPVDYMEQAAQFAKANKIPLHMDGARIMNAATYLGLPVKDILRGCDTVQMCISKGLACPIGSLVAGPKDFIYKVARVRKCLGGAMRQAGIVAAAGLVSLRTIVPRLHEDHENTQRLARGVSLKDNRYISMDLDTVQTNMAVYDFVDTSRLSPLTFCERLNKVTEREYEDLQQAITVKMIPISMSKARAVLHNDVNADDVDAAIVKIRYVIDELCRSVGA
uniref:Aromatic amino acid beta-eliminating lyase/threonine aldolase domain-containing protein n=1 Tax=Amblyomma maculatum TaxID=34609 RepID=G3MR70_AMBMU